jgi:hypothetical protein
MTDFPVIPSPDSPQPVEQTAKKILQEVTDYSRREPAKALAAAFGAGVVLNLLPSRFLFGSVTALAALAFRPTLMTLGVVKAFEIYTAKKQNP